MTFVTVFFNFAQLTQYAKYAIISFTHHLASVQALAICCFRVKFVFCLGCRWTLTVNDSIVFSRISAYRRKKRNSCYRNLCYQVLSNRVYYSKRVYGTFAAVMHCNKLFSVIIASTQLITDMIWHIYLQYQAMPLSDAEKQKRYRQRWDADP